VRFSTWREYRAGERAGDGRSARSKRLAIDAQIIAANSGQNMVSLNLVHAGVNDTGAPTSGNLSIHDEQLGPGQVDERCASALSPTW
jgi:hypothetical protein